MTKYINHILLVSICFLCVTCKKKTSMEVTVFNYALNEPVAGATVVLVERHQGGFKSTSCREVASVTTDEKGECSFEKEKLKKNKDYDYFLAVSNAYGVGLNYPCEGKTTGFLKKGGNKTIVLDAGSFDGNFKVITNNLLNPSQQNDSLSIQINSAEYTIPDQVFPIGGGGVLNTFAYYGMNGFPFPPVLSSENIKTPCGSKIIKVRKRKMGIVSTSTDTVKVYPNQTTTVEINW